MWYYLTVTVFLIAMRLSTMDVISNRYCRDMRPQSYVTIEQLLGMWFGVELINHKQNQEQLGIQYRSSCPIIHISEDNSPTLPPFYKGNGPHSYGTNYGTYKDGKHPQREKYDNRGHYTTEPYYDEDLEYRRTQHRHSSYQGHKYGSEEYPRKHLDDDIKRLRLLWTDSGDQAEYTLKYNVSAPGLWISPAYKAAFADKSQPHQFHGKVQVIKAVGNHLVLTFCHELPDQQLYTVILSRKPELTVMELNDVHELLRGRDLDINNVTKVCSQNSAFSLHVNILVLILVVGNILNTCSRN